MSFCVHVYTIGYMREDDGFSASSAISRCLPSRCSCLVMANNLPMRSCSFGWEAVGVVSYLLIGFWSVRPTAIHAN